MKQICIFLFLVLCPSVLLAQEEKISIWFETASYTLPDSALWPLVKKIHQRGLERVLIEGHCDSIGSVAYNLQLSRNRAKAVKQFLMSNGIREAQIKTCVGWGKSKPVADNTREETRQQNRRVDITLYRNTVIKKDTLPLKEEWHPIEKIDVGGSIRLKNLYFEPGRHKIRDESDPELIRLLKTMIRYPKLVIEIQGHVCCSAPDEDGFDWDTETNNLSENRASAIADFLIEGGISPKRLRIKGFGGSKKMFEDEREEKYRAQNRRVECQIISK
jgi:outer membrane protein OmpA-like peptidoglycan-associated protein